MLNTIRSWLVVAWFILRYTVAAWFDAKRPTANGLDIYPEIFEVLHAFLGWNSNLHQVGDHHCPTDHATILCGNHVKLDDPLYLFRTTHADTQGRVAPFAMARDDFFEGSILKSRFFDGDDFFKSLGTFGVSRGGVTLAQMKPFLKFLAEGRSFILFPGRSRSRSGLFMDYRDDFQEPGGVSFFLGMTQRRHPDVTVSATPLIRTFNPVSKRSAMIYGPEQFLPAKATREQQREFDRNLVVVMSQHLEINVPHVLCAVLYLRCLHRLANPVAIHDLEVTLRTIFAGIDYPFVDPEATDDLPKAVRDTLHYLQELNMLRLHGEAVTLDADAILSTPELDEKYRNHNPVKFLTNQILHLGDVTERIQDVVLSPTLVEKAR
ncbi:MAG: hypothetical protein IID08_02955 [Candidatus Hydrogenedentes bacterium]|nr:hypothetical protein [Candidatus Hydrogenedentota bacterium]